MNLLGTLFGKAAPPTASEMQSRIVVLVRAGDYKQARKELERHRHAVQRFFEGDEFNISYETGFAHYLELTPTLRLALKDDYNRFAYVRLFCASYAFMQIMLQLSKNCSDSSRCAKIEEVLAEAEQLFEQLRANVDWRLLNRAESEVADEVGAMIARA